MRLWQIQVYPERYAGLDRARLCEEIQQGIEVRIAVLEGLEMAEEEMM
jgi:hypothetical protein